MSNPLVNITTIGLIIVFSLGFIVWWDLWDKFRKVLRKRALPIQSFSCTAASEQAGPYDDRDPGIFRSISGIYL